MITLLTDCLPSGDNVDVGQGSPNQDGADGPERSRRLVNVGEDLGSVAGLSEGGKCSGTGVDAAQSDGEDGDANGSVDEVVQSLDAGILEDNDEGRSSSSCTTQETRLVVTDEQTNDSQRGDVDDGLVERMSSLKQLWLQKHSQYARRYP